MSFPNSVVNDMVATTIENRSPDVADNVTQQNALLTWIKKSGGNTPFTGGSIINEVFSFAENGNGGSYSGYDILPTAAQDVISGAQYQICQYAVPVTFSGLETLKNAGKAEIIDLIEARVKVAESTMSNLLNRHLYGDGTGNNGKNLTGLGAAMPLSPTNIYGGIDRSNAANAFWKNKKYQATVDGGALATSATIQSQWNAFFNSSLIRGADKPSVIIAGSATYSMYQSSLQTMQHFYTSDTANAGFVAIMYNGVPVVLETTQSGIASTDAFFINAKYLKWRPHSTRNMVALDDKSGMNQDATVKTLAWAGNLTCSFAGLQGRYSNT